MRNLVSWFFLSFIILSGCGLSTSQHVEIDWVDFIKWDGKEYDGIFSGAIADESFIGPKLGKVQFKVAENVTDPEYKVKDGDAAFHEKGTNIYTVKGIPGILAVKSSSEVNNYKLYISREAKNNWQFNQVPFGKVNRIEIYHAYTPEGNKKVSELNKADQIEQFLSIFKKSKDSPNFEPNTSNGDPTYYKIAIYTGEPIAYVFDFVYDGKTFCWYPDEPSILSNEIQNFLTND